MAGLSSAAEKQKSKLEDMFTAREYELFQLVLSVYQKMVDAYLQVHGRNFKICW